MRLALRWSLVRFVGIAVPLTLMGPLALSGTALAAPSSATPPASVPAAAPAPVTAAPAAPGSAGPTPKRAASAKVDATKKALAKASGSLGLPVATTGKQVWSATMAAPDGVAVAGVTWPTKAGADVQVFLRTKDASGRASAWQKLDTEAPAGGAESPTGGTDPIVVTDAASVEAATVAGQDVGATLRVMSSAETAADDKAVAERTGGDALGGTPASLGIRSRAEWGANESLVRYGYTYSTVTGVMIHHTSGSNSYTQAAVPAILRSVQAYHVNGRGWNDIAYNVLVDKYGTAWEGRGGGLARAVQGGHGWKVTNARVFGLSFMGDYQTAAAPAAMLGKAERIIAWKFRAHGVDPYGTTWGSGGQDGGSTFLNAISGHRDENATDCPGKNVYSRFAEIRSKVKGYMATDWDGDRSFNQDATGDGKPDLAVVDGQNVMITQLLAQPSTPRRALTLPTAPRDAVLAGDLSGDGVGDIVVRDYAGVLKLYRGLVGGGYSQTGTTLASGWGGYEQFIAAPNFGGDRRGALLALDRANRRILAFPGNGAGGLQTPQTLTTAGVDYDLIALAGVWNTTDGTPDLVARRTNGTLDLLAGDGYGTVKSTTSLGGAWGDAWTIVGGANVDGSGGPDLVAVSKTGQISLTTSTAGRIGGTSTRAGSVRVSTEFGGSYRSLTPARILDTRSALGAPGPVAANGTVSLQVAGRGGVPATGVSAVVLNVTVTRPQAAGNVQAWASGAAMPSTSSLNFAPGQDVPNAVVVPVGRDGKVNLRNASSGTSHLIADVGGYYVAGNVQVPGAFAPVASSRLLDTRTNTGATGPIAPYGTATVPIAGRGGVPATGVAAVALNVTVTQPTVAGNVQVYPSGTRAPASSNVNFVRGQTVANLAVANLGADGRVTLRNSSSGTVHLIADIAGYYLAGTPTMPGSFVPLSPTRTLDTRAALGAPGPVAPYGVVALQATGRGGVPSSGVSSVVYNVTVTRPQVSGNIQVYPSGAAIPSSSSLNFVAGQDVPNLVPAKVGTGGRVSLRNASSGTTHLIADVAGYYR